LWRRHPHIAQHATPPPATSQNFLQLLLVRNGGLAGRVGLRGERVIR
jgi:hypothetical protein